MRYSGLRASLGRIWRNLGTPRTNDTLPSNPGYCPCCRQQTVFREHGPWLRDEYLCDRCRSIPRQRHLTLVMDQYYPQWDQLEIHESSPSNPLIAQFCRRYSYSQFFPDQERGKTFRGTLCEDIEQLTFKDASFDIFITQDVLEHVFHPMRALREIHRVLKPGGAHIFTTPKHRGLAKSVCRAELDDSGEIRYLLEAQYHGNPVGDGKALVTWDYGDDFEQLAGEWAGAEVITSHIRDRSLGIDAEFNEVFVIRKP